MDPAVRTFTVRVTREIIAATRDETTDRPLWPLVVAIAEAGRVSINDVKVDPEFETVTIRRLPPPPLPWWAIMKRITRWYRCKMKGERRYTETYQLPPNMIPRFMRREVRNPFHFKLGIGYAARPAAMPPSSSPPLKSRPDWLHTD